MTFIHCSIWDIHVHDVGNILPPSNYILNRLSLLHKYGLKITLFKYICTIWRHAMRKWSEPIQVPTTSKLNDLASLIYFKRGSYPKQHIAVYIAVTISVIRIVQ